ncbi:SPT3 Dosage dependent suppressor of Ty-induced promoter mutations-like protein, partial [Coemansia sp. Cherry 401B]
MRGAYSTCTTPGQSRAGSPTRDAGAAGGAMEAEWDEMRIGLEKKRIVIFNCNDMLDFSKGEVVLPTRITCYCRHHLEKTGFCIYLTLYDSNDNVLATDVSPPIMITDDHKSKFKSDRSKTRAKPEYERAGGGSAAYANHALSGMNSPTGAFPAMAGGARQTVSVRNSPTLHPHHSAYPYSAQHAFLDTYSQFASLAGTPSLGNTPLGSPMLAAAHLGGFDTPFHLPPQQQQQPPLGLGAYTAALPISPMYGAMPPPASNALGLQPAAFAGDAAGIMPQLRPPEPMQIGQLLPKSGPVAGGARVMITGRGFHAGVDVFFGRARATHVCVESPTVVTCVLPPTKAAESVPLRICDRLARAPCEAAEFAYVEDTDQAMLELALQILGLPRALAHQDGAESADDAAASARLRQDPAADEVLRSLAVAGARRNLVDI